MSDSGYRMLGGGSAATVGTTAGTVAAGDDSRITGAAQKAANLSDLASAGTARTNLGLGGAAVLAVGTTTGTVAAGDDSRVTGAAQKASNLSDLASASTSRTNLGLGGAAVLAVGTTAGTVAAGDDSRIVGGLPALPSDHGFLAWSMPISVAVAATALAVAGRMEFVRIRRVPAGPITSITALCTTAGSSLTTGQCFASLHTAAGVLIGQSTDQATAWASNGVKTMTLTGGPFTHTGGDLYVGFWFNGTTGPTLARYVTSGGLGAITNAGLSAPNFVAGTANTGLTTAAPAPMGAQTSTGTCFFAAVS